MPGAERLVVLAPAKVNLGLEVLRQRPDGYHEVATILQAVRLTDRIELSTSKEPGIRLVVTPRGLDLGPAEENLAVRAACLIPPQAGQLPGLEISLAKRIPAGAGFGGGSADAAAVLVGLNRLRGGGRPPEALEELGARLGSDVPFFIRGGTQLGLGRGEILRPAPACPPRLLVLVYPRRPLATRSVYLRACFGLTPPGPLSSMAASGFTRGFWSQSGPNLRNDLQAAAVELEPAIGEILGEFERRGSSFTRVTGSGSGVFGVAPQAQTARAWVLHFRNKGHWSKAVRLSRGGCVVKRM